jgi:hypothetical protein
MHALGIDPNALDGEQIPRMRCEAQCNLLRQVMEKRGWFAADLLRVPTSEIADVVRAIGGKRPDMKQLVLAIHEFLCDIA